MKKLLLIYLLLFSIFFLGQGLLSQTYKKGTFSAFDTMGSNDSVYTVSGQVMVGESSNSARVLHGYLPLQYSLLDISNEEERGVLIYPNPVSDQFKILFAESGNYSIYIYSLEGRIILDISVNCSIEAIVDVNSLNTGLYIIQIFSNQELISTQKIIKN